MRSLRWVLMLSVGVTTILAGLGHASGQSVGEWVELSNSGPTPRSQHAVDFDSENERLLLFGGRDTQQQFGDLWGWNGNSWSLLAESGPSHRFGHAVAYDRNRGVLVLFGGWDGASRFGDTWEWTGQQWSLRAQSGPLPRYGHTLVYDESRAMVILFGGSTFNGVSSDTWGWDGVSWVQFAGIAPGARMGHAAVFDVDRSVILMFGGIDAQSVQLADLWQWDGEWTELSAQGPSARYAHSMVFDRSRSTTIMYGGIADNRQASGDMWEWDGEAWRPLITCAAIARFEHKMAFNGAAGHSLSFGGVDSQWEYLGDLRSWMHRFSLARNPVDLVVAREHPAGFSVESDGPVRPSFQWRRNGIPLEDGGTISGANTDALSISRVFLADAGEYDCVLSDSCGEITSQAATLTVVDPQLRVVPTCPGGGPITVSWEHAHPGGQVALVFARTTGQFTIPNGFLCEGVRLGLGANQIQVAWQGGAGVEGDRSIHASAGPSACGGYMQIVDLTFCTTSNVVRLE